ncbi:MAG: PQQ-binding-like beta-propeller repeat protein, partial [Planctomycetia bacterium]|nr:PQQ-binding-like beta-propeller repeat protein [Planctomycetia bacterium]
QDGFVEVKRVVNGKTIVRMVSIKAEANRLLGTMPKEGMEFYEVQFGQTARGRLLQARQAGDKDILAEVAVRFLHTDAGAEATMLLGTHCLNRDEPLIAALYFDRLYRRQGSDKLSPWTLYKIALSAYRSGDKEAGDEVWKTLVKKIERDGGLQLDAKQFISVGALRAELDKAIVDEPKNVREPMVYRGGPSRTEQGYGGAPFLDHLWTASTLPIKSDVKSWTEDNLNHALRFLQDQRGQAVMPAFFPVAAANKVIYRTYDGVYALNLKQEGKIAWYSHTDGGLQTVLNDANKKAQLDQWSNIYRQNGPQGILFENSVTGSLSTDAARVYVIDDLAIPPHPAYLRNFMWGGAPNFGALTDLVNRNSLKAYNLESGKLVWELGGRFDKESELAGSFFLGPPLPLGGKLYLLNEKNSELRLVCIEPKDQPGDAIPPAPTIVWTQTLANAKDKIQLDFNRRINAAHLAYADGILVCPTNAGAILGVDLLSHSLVWAHSYRDDKAPQNPNPKIAMINGMPMMPAMNSEWRIAAPAIQDGKVVFTAPDGGAVHCLDLRDGSLLWKHSRASDDLYFAGVFHGKALIIGKNSCKALSLTKGEQVWRLDNVGTPSGQGAASENVYYLPLRAGQDKEPEVCAINVDTGRVVAHTKSRKKEVPGNLIFYEGQVLSQTLTSITAYPQLQSKLTLIDERIKQNPKDPLALIERGELCLDKGELDKAYADLHTALENNPPADMIPKAKQKLYETLTDMFQRDFNVAEKYLEEYKTLCQPENAEERRRRQGNLLCLVAKGRERQGRLVDAFQAYTDFGALAGSQELVSSLDEPNTKSSPAVWARGRIAAMMDKAKPEQRQPLETRLAEQWAGVKDTNDVQALRRFADLFGAGLAVGRQARLKLADRLLDSARDAKADELREAQLLLLQVEGQKAVDPEAAGQAVETLARVMLRKGLMDHAAHYYRALGRDFTKVVIKDGKTGADLYSELTTDKRFLPFLEDARQSWNGKFKVSEIHGQFPMQPSFTLEPIGDLLPFFQKHRLALDMNLQQLRVVNQIDGKDQWKSANLPSLQYLNHGHANIRTTFSVQGHVVVVGLGHMVYGLDPVDQKKLWEYNLYAPGSSSMPQLGQVTRDREGNLTLLYQDGWMQKLGQTGAVEASYVCLQTRNGLVALDPIKGTMLWTKSDVNASRTQIFGDEQYVYLVELNGDGAAASANRAVRATDGVTVPVPDFTEAFRNKLKVRGRTLLVKDELAGGATQLRLYDVPTGKDVWKQEFPANSTVLKCESGDIAGVVDPEGNVAVFDLNTRQEVFKAKVKKEDLDKLQEAWLLVDRDQYYVALNKTADPNLNNGIWMNVYHGMRTLTVNGSLYAFDGANGKTKWINPIQNQMLVLEQFKELPVLIFTSRYNKWVNQGNNRIAMHVVATKSLHKASGKLLFDKELSNNVNNFHALQVDPKAGTIDLVSFNLKIRHELDRDGKAAALDAPAGQGGVAGAAPVPAIAPAQPVVQPAIRRIAIRAVPAQAVPVQEVPVPVEKK